MTVIVRPSPDDRVESTYQVHLFRGVILANNAAHLLEERMQILLRRCGEDFAAMSPQVLPQKVEAIFDMRDAGFLR